MDADGADIAREREKTFPKGPFLSLTKMEGAVCVSAPACRKGVNAFPPPGLMGASMVEPSVARARV